jgi:hypothetical protein
MKGLEFDSQHHKNKTKPLKYMVAHPCNLSTWVAKTEGSQVQSQLHCLKKKKKVGLLATNSFSFPLRGN